MIKNKYGGLNDMPARWCSENKRLYALWFGMLRRCYDQAQQERSKGRAYIGCNVSSGWMLLSQFVTDVQTLKGYDRWASGEKMLLDKDSIIAGNRTYSKNACCFLTQVESAKETCSRHPDIMSKAQKACMQKYVLTKDGETLVFESEKQATAYLGVGKCSVASCFRSRCKCKGYTVNRADMRKE